MERSIRPRSSRRRFNPRPRKTKTKLLKRSTKTPITKILGARWKRKMMVVAQQKVIILLIRTNKFLLAQ